MGADLLEATQGGRVAILGSTLFERRTQSYLKPVLIARSMSQQTQQDTRTTKALPLVSYNPR